MATHGAEVIEGYDSLVASVAPIDLYQLGEIVDVRMRFPSGGQDGRLSLRVRTLWTCPSVGSDYLVTIRFMGVTGLEMPKLGEGWFGFSELEIRDIKSHGLEGLRLHVKDYDSELEFRCLKASYESVSHWPESNDDPFWLLALSSL